MALACPAPPWPAKPFPLAIPPALSCNQLTQCMFLLVGLLPAGWAYQPCQQEAITRSKRQNMPPLRGLMAEKALGRAGSRAGTRLAWSRAGQGRAGQGRAGQGRAWREWAGLGWAQLGLGHNGTDAATTHLMPSLDSSGDGRSSINSCRALSRARGTRHCNSPATRVGTASF